MKTKPLKFSLHFILLVLLLLVLITTDYSVIAESYDAVFIAVIIAIYLSLFILKGVFSPITFMMIFFFLQPLVGYLNYSYISKFIPWGDINFREPLLIWFVYIIFFEVGFLAHRFLRNSTLDKLTNPIKIINKNGIKIAGFILIIVSIVMMIYFIMKIGEIPFLAGAELDVARFKWIKYVDSGVVRLMSFSVVGIVLFIYLILVGRTKSKIGMIVLVVYAVVSSLFLGDRIKLLLITLFAIFCFFKINPKVKIRHIALILISLFLLLQVFVAVGFYRGGWSVHGENVFRRSVQMFTEFRDFSQAQNEFQPKDERLREYNIFYSAYSLVPRQILFILDIDKARLLSRATFSGAYSEYHSFVHQLRFSAIGSLYFSFGYYGVFFIFLIGLFYGIINKIFIHMDIRYRYFNTISFFVVLLCLLPMLGIKTTLDYVNLYIYPLFAIEFLTKTSRYRRFIPKFIEKRGINA